MPGYELCGMDTEKVIKNGEEFLKPKEIRVRPKDSNSETNER